MSLLASVPSVSFVGDDHLRIRRLERTVGELRERNRQLQDALSPPSLVPPEWDLTPRQAGVFRCLLARDVATREQIVLAWASDEVEMPGIKTIDVQICKIRQKLARHGVTISVVRGVGFSLDARLSWKARLG